VVVCEANGFPAFAKSVVGCRKRGGAMSAKMVSSVSEVAAGSQQCFHGRPDFRVSPSLPIESKSQRECHHARKDDNSHPIDFVASHEEVSFGLKLQDQ
jgi:hypothetical protein